MRAGRSGSLRDQPKELTESRKVVEAMIPVQTPADLIKREGYKHFFLGITTNGLVCSSASDARKKKVSITGDVCRDYAQRKPGSACR